MTGLDADLLEVIEPLRDLAVGQLLREISAALERGAAVRNEPMIRDAGGRIVRDGALHLPRRGDLAVREGGRRLIQRVDGVRRLSFAPITSIRSDGLEIAIHPFRWDAAQLRISTRAETPQWAPVRRWFLEAFQSRYGDLAPDLDGVVHALIGPQEADSCWLFEVDLGSAPVEVLAEMFDAFALAGVSRLTMGGGSPEGNEVTPDEA